MRFDELSAYFTALCEGQVEPKFLPYDGELPRAFGAFVSFSGNPFPRPCATPAV